jgi:hypothetical protein
MRRLSVGDRVSWRACFGSGPAAETTVTGIELVAPDEKHGTHVDSLPWADVVGRRVVVDLASGCWAYGEQLTAV